MKYFITVLLLFLLSCSSEEELKGEMESKSKNIVVKDLKIIQGNEYYIVDTEKNSYLIDSDDYVRLEKGDSLRVYTYIKTTILEIYK